MKGIFLALLGLLLLAAPAVVRAQFSYNDNGDGTCTITGYSGLGGAVTIPTNINNLLVTGIGDGMNSVFASTSLTSVTIPGSVTNIGEIAFNECTSLTAIVVDPENLFYSDWDGVLFDQRLTTLIQYPGGLSGSYSIPDSVTSVGDFAFANCTLLTSVTIPDSVTTLGDEAFYYCVGLTNAAIPGSVTSIGYAAFSGCSGLTNVTMTNGLSSIGEQAFDGCFGLTSVTIPGSVTNIGDYAFYWCFGLTNMTLANGFSSIGYEFAWQSGLNCITIPGSVTNIADGAFSGCSSLTAIMVNAQNSVYSSLNGVLFDKPRSTLIAYPAGLSGGYTVPGSVMCIGFDAFFQCSLTSITIPGSVTHIEAETFVQCSDLTSVFFQGNAPTADLTVFDEDNSATVYYLPGSTGWVDFSTNTGVSTVLWNPMIHTGDDSFGVQNNQFGFTITSGTTTNMPIVVEACTNLASPVWTPLTNITLTSGSYYFSDSQWTNYPARYYGLGFP